MAVRIRLKRLGRRHRPYYRVCAMDSKTPRDGKAIEELGSYDPMIRETDARAILNGDRIAYWVSQGAKPTEKVQILINKYGQEGTHLEQQQAALERLAGSKPTAPPPEPIPVFEEETPADADTDAPASDETAAEETPAAEEAPAEEAPAEEAPAEEAPAEEAPAEEAPAEEAAAEETPAEETTEEKSTED
ncbi:MAG: 30S ribosomal protein S16 [Pirellulaceae bacterium]|nr:30S ribosomal protein S16 [Pirellulaceae bacterium]